MFSVKLTNNESRKNENIDCKNSTITNPTAILLACFKSLFLTQSTSKPINFGKASAVALVNNKKTKPK